MEEQNNLKQIALSEVKKKRCEGKKKILTRKLARKAARLLMKEIKQPFSAYKCNFCEYYHIGHKGNRSREQQKYGVYLCRQK